MAEIPRAIFWEVTNGPKMTKKQKNKQQKNNIRNVTTLKQVVNFKMTLLRADPDEITEILQKESIEEMEKERWRRVQNQPKVLVNIATCGSPMFEKRSLVT